MPMLQIGTRAFHADEGSVAQEAERMFRLSAERRRYRVEAAKSRLVRAVAADAEAGPAARQAAATILSQGITTI